MTISKELQQGTWLPTDRGKERCKCKNEQQMVGDNSSEFGPAWKKNTKRAIAGITYVQYKLSLNRNSGIFHYPPQKNESP